MSPGLFRGKNDFRVLGDFVAEIKRHHPRDCRLAVVVQTVRTRISRRKRSMCLEDKVGLRGNPPPRVIRVRKHRRRTAFCRLLRLRKSEVRANDQHDRQE